MLAVLIWALAAPAAQAQLTGPYVATAPTKGALYHDGQDDRWLLGGQWLDQADPTNTGVARGLWRNTGSTAGWDAVTVPNSFNAGDLSNASMTGSVEWYRRDFVLPAGAFPRSVPARFRSWIVRFESVNYDATVWLNGRRLGHHAGAYLPFEIALKGLRSGVNRLVVRVDDRRTGASLPPGPSGGWWNFGGIQREVYLRSVARADLATVQVRPLLPCPTCAAVIKEQATVVNATASPQTVALTGAYGNHHLNFGAATIPAHGTWIASAQTTLSAPHLWAPGDPYLYHATLSLTDGYGRRLEGYYTDSGVRSVTVSPTGQVLINGRVLNARGFSLHEQAVSTGSALDSAQLTQLVSWAQQLGATILRAHYPLNPLIEQLADQDGILLWSEIPVYQSNNTYLGQRAWLAGAHAELRENILVNQNHPSVLLWSIGNELPTPPTNAESNYIAGASALAHQLDPTRPVAMAISDWPGVACPSAYAPLDIIGYNDYFGWFDAGGGTTDDRDSLGPFLDSLHACFPNKGMMITEFGFEANRNGPVDERGTYAFQADAARYHLGVFAARPYISAAMWFAMQSFAAHPGWTGGNPLGDPPYVEKGAIDQYGNATPLFAVLQPIYASTPQLGPPPAAPTAQKRRWRRYRSTRRAVLARLPGRATRSR
ncbi:MAG TPA: glycoside hydrolase family 2 TIM barrel-domain containing protein [Solirubrobacteraceae bacterium]|nr:glycoside hydrolase family 2 TIM barrel-domain containing protein [Solirubrobacteraceae bacterium]